MNIVFEKTNLENPQHQQAIWQFEAWSTASPTMLPLKGRVQDFVLSLIGFKPDTGVPLVHAAVTEFDSGVATVGGYITNPTFRHQGYGSAALRHLVSVAPEYLGGIKTYRAHVNQSGLSQFQALGGSVVELRQPPVSTGCYFVVEFASVLEKTPAPVNNWELNLLN